MAETETDAPFDRCARCGALKAAHIVLVDGDQTVHLCMRSTYLSPEDAEARPTEADAEMQAMMDELSPRRSR